MKKINKILKEIYNKSNQLKYKNRTIFKKDIVGSSIYVETSQNETDIIVNSFKKYFNKDTVFYDLGSGLGKMVLHIGWRYTPKYSIGIEYSKEKHQGAIDLFNKYSKGTYTINIKFINSNFLNINISDATVVYINNVNYPDDIVKNLYKKIPKNCLILYKKPLPNIPLNKQNKKGDTIWYIKTITEEETIKKNKWLNGDGPQTD